MSGKTRKPRLRNRDKPSNERAETKIFDLESTLEQMVGDTGSVAPELGGYEIEVLDPSRFPWFEVLRLLVVETKHLAWISEKDGGLAIVCEQPPP